jgi:hypothetical protein
MAFVEGKDVARSGPLLKERPGAKGAACRQLFPVSLWQAGEDERLSDLVGFGAITYF